MNEVLTRAEIEARFPDEWILIVDPDRGRDLNFKGQWSSHSKDRDELVEKSKAYRPRKSPSSLPVPRSRRECTSLL